jgi:RND family efflux transporter MFP subunit
MEPRSGRVGAVVLIAGGITCGLVGAGIVWFVLRTPPPTAANVPDASSRPAQATVDASVTLTPEAVSRAGLQTAVAGEAALGSRLRLPATVEPNGYKRVVVTPLITGRVTSVTAELGAAVHRGDALAEIYSSELADREREFVTMVASLEAAHARLARTERLVALGSLSQQELEAARVEHATHGSDVESARAKLQLLGLTDEQLTNLRTAEDVSSTLVLRSPMTGVVTGRAANTGQNVTPDTVLFDIADLSTVWVVGQVYEQDANRVHVGTPVTVTTPAAPAKTWPGLVSYIDPTLSTDTRTLRVRVELPNPSGLLRFGAYAEMLIDAESRTVPVAVPRAALQTIGDRQFVYVIDPSRAGRYVERDVQVGRVSDDAVEIRAGLASGEQVVTTGSFSLRAERERLGLRPAAPGAAMPAASAPGVHDVAVTAEGFVPARIELAAGQASQLRFTRRTDQTCATEVVIPALGVRRALPLNQPVTIDLPPGPAREIAFSCGLNMVKGTIVVK